MSGLAKYFLIFRNYVGKKFYWFVSLSFAAVICESIGISAIIPLLTFQSSDAIPDNAFFRAFVSLFEFLHIKITLVSILGFIVVVFAFKWLLYFWQEYARIYILNWLNERLKNLLARKYYDMKYSYFIDTNIGYFNDLLTTESWLMVSGLQKYSDVLVALTNAFIYLIFSFFISGEATLFVIVVGGAIQLLYTGIRRKVKLLAERWAASNAVIQHVFIQFINNYKYLKTTLSGSALLDKLAEEVRNNRKISFSNQILNAFSKSTYGLFVVLIFACLVAFFVIGRKENIYEILVPLVFLNRSLSQILLAQERWQGFLGTTGAIGVIEDAVNQLDRNKERTGGRWISRFEEQLEFKNVGFKFADKEILSNIDLVITKNRCIGIAGPSGAGKTTLLDLITGLLDPTDGKIEVDAIDYQQVDKLSMRKLFGYVTQETVIFNGTISENITLWEKTKAGEEKTARLKKACKLADCKTFIEKLPLQANTEVGDKGVKLSGGQRQRLSIAREIYRNKEILIFDEATASLDSRSERKIQKSIESFLGNRTLIIVAHRLSTLKHCDAIYVMQDGQVVEKDTWHNLVNDSNSLFFKMCQEQGIANENSQKIALAANRS